MGLGAPGAHGDANRCFRGGWPHGGYAKRACAEESEEDLDMFLGNGGTGGGSGGWRLKVVEIIRKRWKERARVKCESVNDEIEKLLNCTPLH